MAFIPGTNAAELLDRAAEVPFSEEERDLLHQALQLAQESDDVDTEYKARLSLAASYRYIEDTQGLLTHFSAAVGLHDSDLARFPGQSDGSYPDLFWMYKNAIGAVSRSALFSRNQVDRLLDQMESHFLRAGVPQIAVDIERRDDAILNGSVEQAVTLHNRIQLSTVDDPFDDCPTCKLAGSFEMALRQGNYEEAREQLMAILDIGPIGCVMEPESSLAAYMLIALKAGDEELAHYAQLSSASANSTFQSMGTVGKHLEFLGITGNYAKGLGMLTRYQHQLIDDPLATNGHFGFYAGAWVLLTATARAGYGAVEISGSGQAFGVDHDLAVTQLAAECMDRAKDLALRYDQRNGTDNFSARINQTEENALLDIPLDLGSSNLLLRAQTAVPVAPTSDSERVSRFILAKNQSAFRDAEELLLPEGGPQNLNDVDQLELSNPERIRYLLSLIEYFSQLNQEQNRDTIANLLREEFRRQGLKAVEFLDSVDLTSVRTIAAEDIPRFEAEAQKWRDEDLHSWAFLLRAVAQAKINSPDPQLSQAGRELLSDIKDVTAQNSALTHFATQTRRAELWFDIASGEIDDAEIRHRELHQEQEAIDLIDLDFFYAQAALAEGFDDGAAVLDRILGIVISFGMRETIAILATRAANFLAAVGRFAEAAERARLAMSELQAAGLPSRDSELFLGQLLVPIDPAEAREILERVLMPKLHNRENVEFSAAEIAGLVALSQSLGYDDAEAAAWTALQARDLALDSELYETAVQAIIVFSDVAYQLGSDFERNIVELQATLPAALKLTDNRESELAIRDRIAINQSDNGDPAVFDTLEESMNRTLTDPQRIYVQETMNRVLATFGRLDECLDGCREVARMVLDSGNPGGAAHQLEQGASYAFGAEQPIRGAQFLEYAHNIPNIPLHQAHYYATNLADIYADLGQENEAQQWRSRAQELEQIMDEE